MSKQGFNDKNTAKLQRAISKRDIDLEKIAALILDDADVNALFINEKFGIKGKISPLLVAVNRDNPDLVRILLAGGADPDEVRPSGISILEWNYGNSRSITAAKYCNTKAIFTELFKYSKEKYLSSRLVHTIVLNKDKDFFEFLFTAGKIDLTQQNEKGRNPLDIVNKGIKLKKFLKDDISKLSEMRDLLIKKGAKASEDLEELSFTNLEPLTIYFLSKEDKVETEDQDQDSSQGEHSASSRISLTPLFFATSRPYYFNQDDSELSGDITSNSSDTDDEIGG